ncbi:MAG TPA: hypothetical protein VFA75_07290 [Nevskia sp.]|nr:hypothetical protein [Nevskia sp.]
MVREHYPVAGLDGCQALLPQRSRGSIYQQAAKMKLRAPGMVKVRQNWPKDPFIDASIRTVYERKPERRAVVELAERIGRPRWWVCKRARELGLVGPRFKESPWTDAELELLGEHAHKSLGSLARIFRKHGFPRSETAIKVKLKRLGLSLIDARQIAGLYSAHQLAGLFGVDGKTVTRWISLGMMKASRRGTARTEAQGGDDWQVTEKQVRQFIINNPQSVDLRKVDKLWFIETLGRAAA